jgi:hypothetical protein
MRRSTRRRGLLGAPVLTAVTAVVVALSTVLLMGCAVRTASPSPVTQASSFTTSPSPGPSIALPTPVPTAVPGSGPSPAATAAADAQLIIRQSFCGDVCEATAGTTILDDGRVIWESTDGSGRTLQATLTSAGLDQVRAAIAAQPELRADGDYRARLRPGGVALGHGLGSYRFELGQGAGRVVVTSWDADSLGDQRDQWVIPLEMQALSAFGRRLADPVAWLGAGAFVAGPRVYAATQTLVVIDLFADVGDPRSFPADVDSVHWPFGEPIEAAGEPVAGENGIATRCLIVDAAEAVAVRRAERAAGAHRPPGGWSSTAEYDWHRQDGFVQVSLRQLLPYETGTCRNLVEPSF